MLNIKRVLREEQAAIDTALEREVEALPASAREIARHTLLAGGKRLRPILAAYMGRLFTCNHPDIYAIAGAIEFVHMATLIHDDILDNAATRRGVLAAHKVFTPTQAILAGDVMLAHAAKMVSHLDDTFIAQQFAEAVVRTAAGEIDEFTHLGDITLSHSEYLAIITGKTAWNLRIACQLPARYAGAAPEQVEAAAVYGLELGIAFQIVDDALDAAPESETGKPSGGDLRERKCTPLTRFYVETLSPPEAAVFAEKFAAGSFCETELEAIVTAMREKGLGKKTRDLAEPHLAKAKDALALLPAGRERDVLFQLTDFIKNRRN